MGLQVGSYRSPRSGYPALEEESIIIKLGTLKTRYGMRLQVDPALDFHNVAQKSIGYGIRGCTFCVLSELPGCW